MGAADASSPNRANVEEKEQLNHSVSSSNKPVSKARGGERKQQTRRELQELAEEENIVLEQSMVCFYREYPPCNFNYHSSQLFARFAFLIELFRFVWFSLV